MIKSKENWIETYSRANQICIVNKASLRRKFKKNYEAQDCGEKEKISLLVQLG